MDPLSIESIDVYAVVGPDAKYKTSSQYSDLIITNTIVRIKTASGIEGCGGVITWSESGPDTVLAETVAQLAPMLIGKSAFFREEIFQYLTSRCVQLTPQAQSPIDIALWDIVARFAKMPLYQLLGGSRTSIKSYASTPFLPSIDEYRKLMDELVEDGYKAVKFHTWGIPDKDISLSTAMVKEYGDLGIEFMLDVEGAYNRKQSLEVAKVLKDLDFIWLESPLPDFDLAGYRELRQRTDLQIIPAGNYLLHMNQILDGIRSEAWSSVRVDATLAGGITRTNKIMALAESNSMTAELQSWGYTLSQAANLHMMLAHNNCDYFEQAVPMSPLEYGVTNPIRTDKNGLVHAPEGHGLGIQVDWPLIESTSISHRSFK